MYIIHSKEKLSQRYVTGNHDGQRLHLWFGVHFELTTVGNLVRLKDGLLLVTKNFHENNLLLFIDISIHCLIISSRILCADSLAVQ